MQRRLLAAAMQPMLAGGLRRRLQISRCHPKCLLYLLGLFRMMLSLLGR